MSEQKLQTKILQYLKDKGYWVFKTVVCNRNGIPDIVGCTREGQAFAIEVKTPIGVVSKLQEWNINQLQESGAIAFVARDLETVKRYL